MKRFILSLLVATLFMSGSVFADGYIATYSMKVSNSQEFVKEMDNLMGSDWGKAFSADMSLVHYAFNGYDDATHGVIINYENEEEMANGTASFYQPAFGEFLSKTSAYTENVEQSLHAKVITGGNPDPKMNNVYTMYRMKVKNPKEYAKAYAAVAKAQEESGNMQGGYGLRAQIAGNSGYYTHYAFTGSSNLQSALEAGSALNSSDSFKKFSKKIVGNREIVQTSMIVVLKAYAKQVTSGIYSKKGAQAPFFIKPIASLYSQRKI